MVSQVLVRTYQHFWCRRIEIVVAIGFPHPPVRSQYLRTKIYKRTGGIRDKYYKKLTFLRLAAEVDRLGAFPWSGWRAGFPVRRTAETAPQSSWAAAQAGYRHNC